MKDYAELKLQGIEVDDDNELYSPWEHPPNKYHNKNFWYSIELDRRRRYCMPTIGRELTWHPVNFHELLSGRCYEYVKAWFVLIFPLLII